MAIAGFAGLPRFLAPATALVAVVGAVGIARIGSSSERSRHLHRYAEQKAGTPLRGPLRTLLVATLLLAVAGFGWRLAQLPGDLDVVERQTSSIEHLLDLVEETGGAQLMACQHRVRMTHVREQTALAWKLDEPISSVLIRYRPRFGVAGLDQTGPGGRRRSPTRRLARDPPALPRGYSLTSASGRAIAGVSGATR